MRHKESEASSPSGGGSAEAGWLTMIPPPKGRLTVRALASFRASRSVQYATTGHGWMAMNAASRIDEAFLTSLKPAFRKLLSPKLQPSQQPERLALRISKGIMARQLLTQPPRPTCYLWWCVHRILRLLRGATTLVGQRQSVA